MFTFANTEMRWCQPTAIILILILILMPRALAQGMPVSPCPKIFQYRYDGSEWFGLMAVRSPDARQMPLHIRVTLSMRGKPTTNYLGEIELLTRGQFSQKAPVLYKIRFPKHHYPPKVLLISANNQVICFGTGEQSIFMTQIQLEHIRKLTFIPDKKNSGSLLMDLGMDADEDVKAAEETFGKPSQAHTPPPPHIQFKKKPFNHHHLPKDICGRIDRGLDFRLPKQRSELGSRSSDDAITSPVFADYDDEGMEHVAGEDEELAETEEEEDLAKTGEVAGGADEGLPSITRGSWPWLAAIYVNNLTSLDFQCGGTLISARAVISSAHCFRLFNMRYTSNEVLVFLGRHNLKNWNEEGSLAAPVDGIYIHPDYNSQLSSYDADIAVIMLKDEVRFNTFIRPACLWSGSSKAEYIFGEHGLVIGWSFDRSNASQAQQHTAPTMSPIKKITQDTTSTPKVVNAPVVGNAECFRANAHFRSLSSNRTFCAGIQIEARDTHPGGSASASVFTGISGAGLLILKNNRWMLRGTVSATLPALPETESNRRQQQQQHCCRNQYMIYADVAKFLDWITAFII
ncbi:serine protease gd [Drosophila kikkawai]|uniref:Serine protease gd n=1 Tax=Drosophila kikkawai TaxID=30033 RepID=A0A6P4IGV9_DROKI|nr:serine protease gd [Drosophila kikkawai]